MEQRTLIYKIIIVVIITVVSSGPVPLEPVYQRDTLCHLCPAGTFMEVACVPGEPDTVCTACPEGTFRRKPNHAKSCHPHKTSCDAPYQIKEPVQLGNRTHDAVCHCEHGAIKIGGNKCVKRKTCPPGQGSTKGGQCKQCREGYFSDKLSKFQKCLPVRNCSHEGKETLFAGSRTSNARCGDLFPTKSQIRASTEKNEKLDLNFPDATRAATVFASDVVYLPEANTVVHKKNREGKIAIQDKDSPINVPEDEDNLTENLKDNWTPIPHVPILPLGNAVEATNTPETQINVITRINVILGITCFGLIVGSIALAVALIGLKYIRIIRRLVTKERTEETASLMERTHDILVIGENSALNEDIEEMPQLGQEESCEGAAPSHADVQEHSSRAEPKEDLGVRKKADMQPSSILTAAVRPKQRSLTSQSQAPLSEDDSLQYTESGDDETVPLLLRGSQEVSSPMNPIFKPEGLEVALHPTPPLKDDAETSESQSSMTVDATEPFVPQQSLPNEPEELQEDEEQPTEDVPDGPSDAGPMSQPKELRTEEEDEREETSLKQTSGSPEDDEDIPDIEEIARTAMVRVPSDELSFPVQESAHESDGLEALGAVGGRSGSFSPLHSAEADSDAESSSGDEAYERKVRVAIRDSVAKSLFTGLAHHLSNPAGPGPDWVPLARAAGITGPEIDHIINEAAQDLDKDIRKMLEQYEEGKTGDRPISELYGELIARKRQQLYNTFRRDPPS
ncbi:TNFRSF21 [Branchiostoma lanceolatum]|uniref:TNFRSF21 protein n=1 Tax=Branchiostoma lanceolatum TaxID=7740 RepID=A0A8J9Z9C3_BRALA|nr:TNFRSF21 [Branchiostoma lanceolatum]